MRKIEVVTKVAIKSDYVSPSSTHWQLESTKIIDHDSSADRKWLASHCFWAMRNSRSVTSIPLND